MNFFVFAATAVVMTFAQEPARPLKVEKLTQVTAGPESLEPTLREEYRADLTGFLRRGFGREPLLEVSTGVRAVSDAAQIGNFSPIAGTESGEDSAVGSAIGRLDRLSLEIRRFDEEPRTRGFRFSTSLELTAAPPRVFVGEDQLGTQQPGEPQTPWCANLSRELSWRPSDDLALTGALSGHLTPDQWGAGLNVGLRLPLFRAKAGEQAWCELMAEARGSQTSETEFSLNTRVGVNLNVAGHAVAITYSPPSASDRMSPEQGPSVFGDSEGGFTIDILRTAF